MYFVIFVPVIYTWKKVQVEVKWKYVQFFQHLVTNSFYIYILAAEWVLRNFFALRKKRTRIL